MEPLWEAAVIWAFMSVALGAAWGTSNGKKARKNILRQTMNPKGTNSQRNVVNQIAAHNAAWPSQFRFAGNGFWSGVCAFYRSTENT
jgi:hypothetical protein